LVKEELQYPDLFDSASWQEQTLRLNVVFLDMKRGNIVLDAQMWGPWRLETPASSRINSNPPSSTALVAVFMDTELTGDDLINSFCGRRKFRSQTSDNMDK